MTHLNALCMQVAQTKNPKAKHCGMQELSAVTQVSMSSSGLLGAAGLRGHRFILQQGSKVKLKWYDNHKVKLKWYNNHKVKLKWCDNHKVKLKWCDD